MYTHPLRWKAAPMSRLQQGLQSKQQSDHPYAQACRRQTICMRALWRGIPEEGRSEKTHGNGAQCQDPINFTFHYCTFIPFFVSIDLTLVLFKFKVNKHVFKWERKMFEVCFSQFEYSKVFCRLSKVAKHPRQGSRVRFSLEELVKTIS